MFRMVRLSSHYNVYRSNMRGAYQDLFDGFSTFFPEEYNLAIVARNDYLDRNDYPQTDELSIRFMHKVDPVVFSKEVLLVIPKVTRKATPLATADEKRINAKKLAMLIRNYEYMYDMLRAERNP